MCSRCSSRDGENQTEVIFVRKEEKKWLHAPETLLASHVVYLVKVSGDGVAADAYGMALVTNNECGSGQLVPAHGDFNIRIFSSSAAQKWTSRRASTW